MKIGILTLAIAENYGGTMQAIALYRLLHNEGHEVVLIYKIPYISFWKKLAKEVLLKIPFHDIDNIKTLDRLEQERQKRKSFHAAFINKEIFEISKDLETKGDLETFVSDKNLEAVIVGSDQVWRKDYIKGKFYKSFFLDFISKNDVRKIAYAASFGKNHWQGKDDVSEIATLMHDFTAVSTRELSGTQICKDTFNYSHATHVLDPTMLMSQSFYMDEIVSKYDTSNYLKGGLVTYVLDEAGEKTKIINYIKDNLGINTVNHLKAFNTSNINYSVPEWLRSIAEADYVVTDSFHGMAFSIIFQKNFTVVGNNNRGLDRFVSLLSLLNLRERLVIGFDDISDKTMGKIDYSKVNQIVEQHKQLSISFLLNSLEKND
jgi:hypothetical protein